jgi:hypothetical protein
MLVGSVTTKWPKALAITIRECQNFELLIPNNLFIELLKHLQ